MREIPIPQLFCLTPESKSEDKLFMYKIKCKLNKKALKI